MSAVHRSKIVEWLSANEGWHYGLDVAAGAGVSRSLIYYHLGQLEEAGEVERRVGEKSNPGLPRPLYRLAPSSPAGGRR